MSPSLDLHAALRRSEVIARRAGELLRAQYSQPRQIEYKGAVNLVTQADHAAEELIISSLAEEFPDHAVVAEEGREITADSGLTWLVDPLDGTTNFAHGFPVFAVSLALRDPEGILLGVVYDPLRDECFTAARGQGAHLNEAPIHVSATPELGQALLATGFPYDRQTAEDNNVAAFGVFLRRSQGIRRAGAAALDLAYTACGRLDGFWEMRLKPWDMGAGLLMVREAGGRVSTYDGDDRDDTIMQTARIVASNGLIHAGMLSTLHEIYPDAS